MQKERAEVRKKQEEMENELQLLRIAATDSSAHASELAAQAAQLKQDLRTVGPEETTYASTHHSSAQALALLSEAQHEVVILREKESHWERQLSQASQRILDLTVRVRLAVVTGGSSQQNFTQESRDSVAACLHAVEQEK